MIVTLQTERVQTLADVRAVTDGNDRLDYQFTDREAAYEFIRRTLVRFDYPTLSKPDCCSSLCSVGTSRYLTGLFRRRIAWDDGTIREGSGAGEVAFAKNRCC